MFRAKILSADGGAARGRKVDGASARSYDMDISSLTEVTEDPSHHLREGYFLAFARLTTKRHKKRGLPLREEGRAAFSRRR